MSRFDDKEMEMLQQATLRYANDLDQYATWLVAQSDLPATESAKQTVRAEARAYRQLALKISELRHGCSTQ